MELVRIVVLVIVLLCTSCTSTTVDHTEGMTRSVSEQQISDDVISIINQYIDELQSKEMLSHVISAIKVHLTCQGMFIEMWPINHPIYLHDKGPAAKLEINGVPILIYEATVLEDRPNLLKQDLKELIRFYPDFPDEKTPPRTGFRNTWLYNPDANEVFSVIDSMLQYKDDKLLDKKVRAYTGEVLCW